MSVTNNTTRFGGILRPFKENNYARSVLGPLHLIISSLTSKVHQTYAQTIGSQRQVQEEQMIHGQMNKDGEFEFVQPVLAKPKTQHTQPVIAPKQQPKTAETICLLTGTLFLVTVLFGIAQIAGMDLQTMGLIAYTLKNSGVPIWSPVAITLVSTLALGFICAAIENKRRKDSWQNDFKHTYNCAVN